MKPAAWLKMLHDDENGCYDSDAHFILDGVLYGFHMVDPNATLEGYFCNNYQSSLSCHQELSTLLMQEISTGKLSISRDIPHCTHALGAIIKPTGKIRPITDCSRP